MPMVASKVSENGIEWQLWESKRADDPWEPLYLRKKFPNGYEHTAISGMTWKDVVRRGLLVPKNAAARRLLTTFGR